METDKLLDKPFHPPGWYDFSISFVRMYNLNRVK